ncbi:hypothetical protein RUM43_011953 [Polyplax serrata]|uniref:ZP domain-containing protein n=1 Tax=Polyplax serrata TaxID=468196 RepID=A0AAN8P1T7_POLSC
MLSCESALIALVTLAWSLSDISCTVVQPRVYLIENVNSTCTSQEMKIRLELNRNFKGLVYAKGFPLEKSCRTYGTGQSFVDISIDTSACGVRLVSTNDETLTYRITLSVQMDRFLQQINDLEVSTACNLPTAMMHPKQITRQVSRTGRNKVSQVNSDISNDVLTWMEIEGTSELSNINKVFVGEQTMMLIKSFLPENVDANVVDCYAYDGTRDVVQKLLDDNGCPLDETIMPSLEHIKFEGEEEESGDELEKLKMKPKSSDWKMRNLVKEGGVGSSGEEKTRLRVMGTMFPAFKFPDTSNLHLRCSLQVCRNKCPLQALKELFRIKLSFDRLYLLIRESVHQSKTFQVSCDLDQESTSNDRLGKSVKTDKNSSTVIERIEVFNSVEVLAPGIDVDGYSSNQDIDTIGHGDSNSFCLSTSKMAFAFAILGAVFLCGVLAVLWTVMRNHMRKANKVDGSEQVLVVRDSPLNFRNVRSKMHHWSYS